MKKIGPLYFPDADTHFQVFEDQYGGVVNYQRPQRDYALTFVKDFRLALDIGGHVGIFSRHFAEHFEKVVAFEPVAEVRECLALNVPSNVEIRPQAVSDMAGVFHITTPGLANSGNAFIDHVNGQGEPVEVIRIDDLSLSHLGLIKIDVQGEDYRVLHGARKTIKRCKTVVLIEEKPIGNANGSVEHVEKIQALMAALGATRRDKYGADRVYTFE